jgi:hypothetical protein
MGASALPEGRYMVKIDTSEWKDAKSGNGQYLQLDMAICQGQYSGRKLISRLNLRNTNQVAAEIAKKEFACILKALGMQQTPQDTQQIHNIPMLVDVVCEPYTASDGTEKMSNKIVGYHNRATAQASHAEPAQTDAPWGARPAAPAAQDEAPW